MKKRILALVMCLVLMACALPVQAADGDAYTRASFCVDFVDALGIEYTENMAQELSDVSPDHEAYEAICTSLYYGYMALYENGDFKPESSINRAETAVVISKLIADTREDYDYDDANLPSDMRGYYWSAYCVEIALAEGFMSVDEEGYFLPGDAAAEGDVDFDKVKAVYDDMFGPTTSSSVTLDISNGSIEISVNAIGNYVFAQGENITVTSSNTCLIRQSDNSIPSANTITVKSGSVKINLAGVNIETDADETSPIKLESGASLTLNLVGDNTFTSSNSPGIWVPENATLTIGGSGAIATTGQGAGIGGDAHEKVGTIIINSGTVTANGGIEAAGIGSGCMGESGTITINGGTVIAVGGSNSAGIGGSYSADGGTITITGGTVTADTGAYGAGIGGGRNGNGGTITISGGTVTATGGDWCAGIGGGDGGDGGTITITDGTVTATGGDGGAGIGGAHSCDGGTISISGGIVTATGGLWSAGIGGGYCGNGGIITISGGTVTANSGDFGAGIGGGDGGDGGTITISGGIVTANSYKGAGIGGGGHYSYFGGVLIGGDGGSVSISNATVTASGYYHAIGGGDTDNSYGCDKIDIGENVTLELSIDKTEGVSLYQERIDINTQPISAAALCGNGAYAKTEAYGFSGIESYQWQALAEDGTTWTDVDGRTAAEAQLPVSDEGTSYRCKITNVYGNVVYTDTVKAYTLAFAQQPQDANVEMGDIASLSVKSSCDNVTYRWERSYDGGETWSAVPGENYSVLIVDATLAENGALYRCVITATNGDELASDAALISVNTDAVTYTTEFYLENADGSYTLASREVLESEAGKSVTAAQRSFDHYIENSSKGSHSGVVTSDSGLVLSRYYERQSYTISFVTNGAGAIDGITAKWETAVSLPDSLSRYGFVFGGWYTDAGFETEANISEMPTQDITLYAKWTAVGAGRGIEYKINSISVMDGDYQSCDSIPEGVFYAQVSVTNLESETMDTLVLAAYSVEGQMLGLYFLMADPMADQTFNLGAMIDNSNGAIAEQRAFMLPMLGGELIPLANSVSFK